MKRKLLYFVVDGVPLRNWRRLFGNLEGWVQSGDAQTFTMRAELPSTSASCYASIHTGLSPQVHGCVGNHQVQYLNMPDVFSEIRKAGGITGAVAHSFWSTFFQHSPFEPIRDLEYDDSNSHAINHGRFHSMTGYNRINQMTPSDADLLATLGMLCQRFDLDYGLWHSCTLDSMGHRYQHDCTEMDEACAMMDEMLAHFIPMWRKMGYDIMISADHGQSDRGHHGGREDIQQDYAVYYFGNAKACDDKQILSQLQTAPTILNLLGVDIPETMKASVFLK